MKLRPKLSIIDHFQGVEDPRIERSKEHLLIDILILKFVCVGWFIGASPVLVYLLLHPAELTALRGLDLFISFGPATLVQSAMVLFYSRLQVLLDKLYGERLQYYSKVIEEQAIRASAMEEAFTQFHNGPLQSLAVLLRDVQRDRIPSPEVVERLAQLNAEIRDVGQSLIASTQTEESIANPSPEAIGRSTLRLGSGTLLDLNLPLDRVLHEVYTVTLKRNLPHFQTIRAKIRNFDRLENVALTFDLKRELCLWLEESLCNVGKHAQGVTRIQVTGTSKNGRYTLTVRDNMDTFGIFDTDRICIGNIFNKILKTGTAGEFDVSRGCIRGVPETVLYPQWLHHIASRRRGKPQSPFATHLELQFAGDDVHRLGFMGMRVRWNHRFGR